VVELVISERCSLYIAPPETPPAQLAVLRAAFDKTVADPQFRPTPKGASTSSHCPPGREVVEAHGAEGHRGAPKGDQRVNS
jgi:tripartite-type tricarboxylate transporter receptor subunit TctC